MSPATPNRTPFSLSRTRAGGVIRPTGPIGRDGRLAPDRDGTPALARASSRVPRALQRAKIGQRAPEAPLGVASDSPIENRAGAAFAHGDAGAARHVRDDRHRRYVGVPKKPCARATRANPRRTRRGPKGRAPRGSHEAPHRACAEKSRSALSDIPRVFHVDSGVSRNARLCARGGNSPDGIWKIARERIFVVSRFGFGKRENRTVAFFRFFRHSRNPTAKGEASRVRFRSAFASDVRGEARRALVRPRAPAPPLTRDLPHIVLPLRTRSNHWTRYRLYRPRVPRGGVRTHGPACR